MAFHAKLSPSSAKRWMNCAGSVALIGDESSTAGIEARRGTAAHKVIEQMVERGETDASTYHNCTVWVHIPSVHEAVIDPEGGPRGDVEEWEAFVCDDAMVNGVQTMLDEVERVRAELFDPELYTERYLDMTWLDSRLGGTADVTLYEPMNWIHLFDYKNGRIVVEVEDNEQMKNYAVGLLHEHPDADGVTVHLVQPNAIHEDGVVREESYTADELKLFEIQMKEAADATAKPNAPRRAGEWCTFCPAKVRCPEFDAIALSEAGMDFADDPISDEPPPGAVPYFTGDDSGEYRTELARKAKWIPVLLSWARTINQNIFNELLAGRPVPGKKLVRGKSNRKIGDPHQAAKGLVEDGLPEDQIYTEPTLKTPAQLEKIRLDGMKPKEVKAIVAKYAVKPEGRLTVANEDDAREAIDPALAAASDFADDPLDDFGVA